MKSLYFSLTNLRFTVVDVTVSDPQFARLQKTFSFLVDTEIDPVRRNAEAIIKYTTACPFRVNDKSILCVYCGDLYNEPTQFRLHMDDEHAKFNYRMPFEKLPKSEYVKVDVINLRCRICATTIPNVELALTHLKEHYKNVNLNSPCGVMSFVLDSKEWNCAVCQASHPSLLHLNRHTITHFRSYVCEVCGKSYVATTGLLHHVRMKHENQYKAYCRRCGMVFSSMENKNQHQKMEKKCMAYCCSLCPDRFPTWEIKQQHMVEHHELDGESVRAAQRNASLILRYSTAYPFRYNMATMKLQCYICLDLFDEPSLLRTHMDTHHDDVNKSKIVASSRRGDTRVDIANLRCKSCMTKFDTIESIATHLNEIHKLDVNLNYHHGLVPMKLEKNRFQCLICAKLFTGLKQLWRHAGGHFYKYICDVCGKHFETPAGLNLHVKYSHSGTEICKHCKQSFPTKKARREHVKMTKACQPTMCPYCNDRFLHWQQKEEHLVTVHGKERRVFPCTECDKVFTQRTVLYVHFRTTHTDENKCQYCEKQFPTQPRLKEHIARYHTGERAFACDLCDKTFIDGQSLRRHLVTHDDSKKLACSFCDKLYARRHALNLHMAKHHPNANND
ncbi:hypothetical protein MSG28_014519 [Choristoneura fumiferana]|uniref:Uncharacterized protein n=1 Tax=Choristoneura fumiferana TaxID=7141 RepID=A0ACC0JRP4_CHOFU|nr:hypothetical protein MSG28_014519 [Choristoneura fumiferana]